MTYFTALELQKEPFSTSPDPSFFYKSSGHYTALNRLEISIRLRRGLSLILGDVGTGKSTLLRTILQCFNGEEDDYIFHMILDPSFKSEHQFLAHLTKIFGIESHTRSTIEHRDAIEQYLFRTTVEELKTVVLMIDEGQKLNQTQLEILRTLLNYETNEHKLLQLVILGQMELLPRVKRIRNFMDRVSLKYIINPLDEYETGQLIDFRMKQAGYHGAHSFFSYEAVKRIYEFTQGYPRKISLLCHNAIERVVMHDGESVTADLIDRIIAEEAMWV